ncbi:MAG: hypothetical protein HFF26_09360 [Oscillospiraceae bacterium]|nr:hypothetical protein [Oscillospiraceae bacterium]
MAYNFAYDVHRYSQSVMAVRCVSVEENPYLGGGYLYHLEWVEPVCRMDAYDLPEQGKGFTFYGSSVVPTLNVSEDAEGTRPFPSFEVGKTYLIRGDFIDFDTQKGIRAVPATKDEPEHMENYWYRYTADYWEALTGQDATKSTDAPYQRLCLLQPVLPVNLQIADYHSSGEDIMGHPYPIVPNFYMDTFSFEQKTEYGTLLDYRTYVPEDSWPFYAEYEGDWRDFLNTEEGRVWREEIIPNCELNYDSVPILLTDNVQGLSQFCKEESALLEGRYISQEEYETGAAVCMVGADYALYNNLKVGDTLTLDLYKPAYYTSNGTIHYVQPVGFFYTRCMPLVEENRLDVTRDYTIVGLYSAPARPQDPDGHGFRGDTVLVPKASAPEVLAVAEEDKLTPLLNTLVLKNGSIEEFETYMAENGAAGRFTYFDYGYSEMKASIEAMEASALRLAALGGAAFLIGAAVFLLAGFARMAPAARGLRLMGASPRRVAAGMLSALLPLTAAGVALGGVLGGLLYGSVCQAVLSEALAPDWPGLAVCAGLEFAALAAVSAVWAALAARQSLMRRKRE